MARTFGANLGSAVGGASTLSFADLILMSGNFDRPGSGLGYDSAGWPLMVDGSQGNPTIPLGLNAHLPAGTYVVSGRGNGVWRVDNGFTFASGTNATATTDGNGRLVVTVTDSGSGWVANINRATAWVAGPISFVIMLSTADAGGNTNHLRSIKFVLPGHVGRVYYQGYLDSLQGYKAFRFLDWSRINGGTVATPIDTWTHPERLGNGGFAFSMRSSIGAPRIPEEYQAALINELYQYNNQVVDYWLQGPHFAITDGAGNWVQGAHDLIENGGSIDGYTVQRLNSASKIYFEVSNETWNNFAQQPAMLARRNGSDAALVSAWQAANPGHSMGGFEYISHIKAHVARKFKDTFAGSGRTVLVTVMQQGVNPSYGRLEITNHALPNLFDGGTTTIDVLGGGYYLHPGHADGSAVGLRGLAALYPTDPTSAISQFFANEPAYCNFLKPLLAQYATLAAGIGAQYATYEFGEDSNAYFDNTLNTFLLAVHRDPGMEANVANNLIGGLPDTGLHMIYKDCDSYAYKFYWGMIEYTGQPLASAPKLRALRAAMSGTPDTGPTGPPSTPTARTRWPRGAMWRLLNS